MVYDKRQIVLHGGGGAMNGVVCQKKITSNKALSLILNRFLCDLAVISHNSDKICSLLY